jgi:hypothetical protein
MFEWIDSHNTKSAYLDLMLSAPLIEYVAVRDRYDQKQCLQICRGWQRTHLFNRSCFPKAPSALSASAISLPVFPSRTNN